MTNPLTQEINFWTKSSKTLNGAQFSKPETNKKIEVIYWELSSILCFHLGKKNKEEDGQTWK